MIQRSPPRSGALRRVPVRVAAPLTVGVFVLLTGAHVVAQTFRSAIDLIAVDVHVATRDGQPIVDLGPEQFEVTLDGRKRRVVSATFTRHEIAPPVEPEAPIPSLLAGPVAPAVGASGLPSAIGGRTFIISIDTSSFRSLDARVAVLAAQRFTRQLASNDAVGVFTLPQGPRLTPTTSHATARQTLATIVGRKPVIPGQFDMSVEQIIDITATAANQSLLQSRRTVGQMFSEENVSGDTMDCSGTTVSCTESALNEAEARANALEEEVQQGVAGLDSLLRLLQGFPGRKTVLLLSGGMPVSDRGGGRPNIGTAVKQLGEQATYANATIHAVYFDPNLNAMFSSESRRPRVSSGRDRIIYTRALAEFSEPSGGTLVEVSAGAGESEIDNLIGHISTFYVLGVEPEDRDRDGRPHRLQVKVGVRGAQVRARQLVVVPRNP